MHHSQDGESSIALPLAHAIPSAQSYTISELIAFPSSLAALKHGIKWNASCWVANQRLNEFEQEQIGLHAFRGEQRTPHIEWCQFATDVNDTVSILIVFPQLQTSFRSPDVMQRWTDNVVLPAFRAIGIADGTLTSNYKIIQLTAEAEREQTLNTFAPDTTLTEVLSKKGGLSSNDMHNLWAVMQKYASNTVFFDGFKSLFLVAVHRLSRPTSQMLPIGNAWRQATIAWDNVMDMKFVPLQTVKANASATINAHDTGYHSNHTPSGVSDTKHNRTTAEPMWESSRKRRLDDEDSIDKRTRIYSEFNGNDVEMHM